MIKCSHCKTYVADEMAFCTNCGEALEFETVIRPPVATTASYEYTEIEPNRTVLKITGVIGGLLIFGSVLYIAGRFTAPAFQPPTNANQIVLVTATPTPTPRTPEPTPQPVKKNIQKPKPKPTPFDIDEMRARIDREMQPKFANSNRPPSRYYGAECRDGSIDNRLFWELHLQCRSRGGIKQRYY